jgi:hypothetical protein
MTYKNMQNNLKTSNMIQDIEKEMELIQDREKTMANPEFQAWMRELNVSQSFEDRTAKIQAYDLQMQYNTKMYSKLNFNK